MLDQLARFAPVMRMIEAAPGTRLLDVGSGSQGVARYAAPRWRITACDIDFSDYGSTAASSDRAERVAGSVLQLPFPDGSFDVVVALDLIEHIGPADRPRALSELARVGRRRVIVGCPCGGPALAADRRLARLYAALRQPVPPWLAEHLDNGFPEPQELADGLAGRGRLRLVPNEWLPTHELIGALEATPPLNLAALALCRRIAPAVVQGSGGPPARAALRLLRGGDRRPAYRTIALLDL